MPRREWLLSAMKVRPYFSHKLFSQPVDGAERTWLPLNTDQFPELRNEIKRLEHENLKSRKSREIRDFQFG